jgi:hypothetical protein
LNRKKITGSLVNQDFLFCTPTERVSFYAD